MTTGKRRFGASTVNLKCPRCGDLGGQHVDRCKLRRPVFNAEVPYLTDADRRYLAAVGELPAIEIVRDSTELVQRIKGDPHRPDPHPDYIVCVQIISLHQRGEGRKPEMIEESELAEVDRYPTLAEAVRRAESITTAIRAILSCNRCSGCGELDDYGSTLTCPDCNGTGQSA